MCGSVIILWTVKYVWTSYYTVDSQVCVDQLLHYRQSSMSEPVITLWTVKYVFKK